MYCSKCGKENNNTSNFCKSCGAKLEKVKNNTKQNNPPTLSILSLIFCILQFVATFIASKINYLDFLYNIPWVVISLVLAIISRCLYKDTLSLVLIIVDVVLIVLIIIGFILLFFFLISALETMLFGCSQLA